MFDLPKYFKPRDRHQKMLTAKTRNAEPPRRRMYVYGRRGRVGCRRRRWTTLTFSESCVQGDFNRPGRAGLLCHVRNMHSL